MNARRRLLALTLLVALHGGADAHAESRKLKYDVRLFGVDVGEIDVSIEGDRIVFEGETAGALYLFFRAQERVEIDSRDGRPHTIVRRYTHPKRKGEWRLTFGKRQVTLVRQDGGKKSTHRYKVPSRVYDPATALQRLRKLAPAEKVSMLLFGVDGIYRFSAKRVAEAPLHYRGTFQRTKRLTKRRKRRPMPPWLRALGLGKGATPTPELNVWLSNDVHRVPTRIRMSDPRGSMELVLAD